MFTRRKLKKEVEDYLISNQQDLYRLAYGYVKNSEDALDVVQDSIIKALTSVDSLKNLKGLKTWVYRIVVHTALDVLRKNKRVISTDEETLDSFVSKSKIEEYEDIDLTNALAKLPATDRGRIILRYYEDFKLEDIAKILNENVNTTKTRLYSTLRKLRLQIEEPSKEA